MTADRPTQARFRYLPFLQGRIDKAIVITDVRLTRTQVVVLKTVQDNGITLRAGYRFDRERRSVVGNRSSRWRLIEVLPSAPQ